MMSTRPKAALRQPAQRVHRVRLDSIKNPQPRSLPQIPRPATPQVKRPPIPTCTNKTCPKSDVDEDDGKLVCKTCGVVISDVQITQEITFGESSNGAAVVQGAYVGANEEHGRNSGMGNSKLTGGADSREVTLRNGRMAIQRIANGVSALDGLNLTTTHHDRALSVYTLAIGINFIQGREIDHVAAACLYIACRRDPENRVMLIDFSDTLKVDVFKLGHTYNTLAQELGLRKGEGMAGIGEINPEHLIYRFAGQLDFGDDYIRVANEATKILQRMRRDWMAHGRRPSGICGAALILAARMNNYRRTVREVVYIAKVTDLTISKRLDEFKYTQSSGLTVAEFRNHGLESGHECDPPAFYRQFLPKKKRKLKKDQGTAAEEISGSESDRAASIEPSENIERDGITAIAQQAQTDNQTMPPPPIPIDPALLEVSARHLSELESSDRPGAEAGGEDTSDGQAIRKPGRPLGSKNKPLPTPSASQIEDENAIESDIDSYLQDPATLAHATELHEALNATRPASPPATQQNQATSDVLSHGSDHLIQTAEPSPPPLVRQATERARPVIPDTEIIPEEEFAGDPEVDNCLLTEEEIRIKERIWVHENGDYLRTQQARLIKKQLAEASGTARVIVRRKRKRGRMGDMSKYQTVNEDGQVVGPSTPEEAVAAMMKKRGYSRKINYEAIKHQFASTTPSESRGTSTRDSVTGAGDVEDESRPTTPLVTVISPSPPTAPAEKSTITAGSDQSVTGKDKDKDVIMVDDEEEDEDDGAAGPVPELRRAFGTVDPDAVTGTGDDGNDDLTALQLEAEEGVASGEEDDYEEEYEVPPIDEEEYD